MITNEIYQTVIDTIPNPIIITNATTLLACNQKFLKFFGYATLQEFVEQHKCVCNLFIEDEAYFSLKKIKDNTTWIEYTLNNPTDSKVLIKDMYGIKFIFKLNISLLNEESNKYIVVFTDITASEKEKVLLKNIASHDALTGIYNRQFFDKILKKEKENLKRHQDELSLLMFDIDHFKAVNDTYGHKVGDAVLIKFTTLVKNNLRENDIFVRWGGEEFIVLLPRTSVTVAYEKAHKLRQIVKDYIDEDLPQITVSVGVTSISVKDKNRACFKRVDDALYKAKEKRNSVVLL